MPEPTDKPSITSPVSASPSQSQASAPAAPQTRRGLLARLEDRVKRWLNPKPLCRKLAAISVLNCLAAVAISASVLVATDFAVQFISTRGALQSLSHFASQNSSDSLARGTTQTAIPTLNGLMEYPGVTGVVLYRQDGRPFARPTKNGKTELPAQIEAATAAGTKLGTAGLTHFEPVMQDAQRIGTLAVAMGYGGIFGSLKVHGLIMLAVLVLAIVAVRRITRGLQGVVIEPVADLASLSEKLATDGNYALRAEKHSTDETGRLADGFNHLLSEIQKRDEALKQAEADLQQANADLEKNVVLRTSEMQNEVMVRRQAEEAMKDSEARYRNLFENNPVPMFVMDLESLNFIAVNHAAVRHYGYSQQEFLLLSLPAITKEADPLHIERAFRSNAKSFDAGEWKHKKRGGDVIEVQLTAHAISYSGKVAKIVLANDVTERNRVQREIEVMHKKLVEASRAAGKAEVATGVLHNVGNVLNSVNVSANLLSENVRKSKAASVRKVADLLEANKADLAAFFSNDGKGKLMPGYLATLAQQIEAEQKGCLAEIEQLSKNISHIRDIVAMQQDYAKVTGVMEDFTPRALIDEAVRVTGPELQGNSVKLEIECPAALPKVNTDRHKVLQILVNLITNSQQAMAEVPPDQRKIILSATSTAEGRVRIAVQDKGCGIAQENLTRVFNHGFTTRAEGHGFGLHCAANAATEIGGSLKGASEGPGKGATFTLELPATQPAQEQHAEIRKAA